MKKDSLIVVFGASGLVGGAMLRKLLERGYSNIIGTYKSNKPHFENVRLVQVDLTNQQQTEQFIQYFKPDYIFLAAARVGGILANNTYKANFIYDNLAIAINVINSAYRNNVKKLLNLGSSCIYPKFAPQPMKEEYLLTGSLEPTNEPYAIAKISAIKLCRYFNEQYGTNFISVMPTNLYGPFDNFDLFTSHVLPALIRKFHLGKCLEDNNWNCIRIDLNRRPIEGIDGKSSEDEIIQILQKYGITANSVMLWGSGNVYREFLHVDDLTEACMFLMENVNSDEMKKICPDYFVNIGTGEDLTIKEIALIVKNIIGFSGTIEHDLSKPDGTPRKLLDVSKINELGWKYKVKLEDGIKNTYEWYRTYKIS